MNKRNVELQKALAAGVTMEEIKVLGDLLSREVYRDIKSYNRETMAIKLARLYHCGIEEAKAQAYERAKARLEKKRLENGDVMADLDADELLADIMSIKGVGMKIGGQIATLFEAYAEGGC